VANCTPGKHPLIKRGFRGASVDPAEIHRWWTRQPLANIGLDCVGSGLVVVDIDPRNGGDATWASLLAKHGDLRSPVRSATGGGGEHHFFSAAESGWQAIAASERPGIDIKHHGYVVLPPSRHASGRVYAWQVAQ
jgi:hypothetical protein